MSHYLILFITNLNRYNFKVAYDNLD